MQYIECTATGATLEVTDAPAMAAGFADVFAVRCGFDDAWDGLDSRVASFRVTGMKPTSVVEVDGAFTVPPEVNAGPSFDFAISGTAGDGRRITTNAVTVTVASSVPVGDEAGDPTPSVSAQALEAAQTAAASAADALAKASQALTDAANALAAATEAASRADTAKSAADAVTATAEAAQTAAEAAAAKAAEATAAIAPATASTLGTVMVGDGLSVTAEGVLSAEGGGTGEVADGSITTAKIADRAVTGAKIAIGTIGASCLSSSEKITYDKISNDTLRVDNFNSNYYARLQSNNIGDYVWRLIWPIGSVYCTTDATFDPNKCPTYGYATKTGNAAALIYGTSLGYGCNAGKFIAATWEALDNDGTVYRWKRIS